MTILLVEQALALVGIGILAALVHRFTRLGLPLACILCGFLAGQTLPLIGFDTGIPSASLRDLVFFVILPVLVFETAWQVNLGLLRRWLWPVLLISTAGMLASAVLAGGILFLSLPHAALPWVGALLTGAILAATDPAPVIRRLHEARAPEDLAALLEGESLLNDATAVVLFSLVLTLALSPEILRGNGLGLFAAVILGGAALGLVTGLAASLLLLLVGRPAHTTIVLLFTAFGTFFLAEHVLNVSGIMAVVVAATVVRSFLKEVQDSVARGLTHTWEWSGELLNSVLFVIMGLTLTPRMFTDHWLAMIVAIGAALVSRGVAIGACGALTQLGRRKVPLRWQGVLVWGGLRGVIALALALALPAALDYGAVVQAMVFGVILFSLIVQDTTSGALIRTWATERRSRERRRAEARAVPRKPARK